MIPSTAPRMFDMSNYTNLKRDNSFIFASRSEDDGDGIPDNLLDFDKNLLD